MESLSFSRSDSSSLDICVALLKFLIAFVGRQPRDPILSYSDLAALNCVYAFGIYRIPAPEELLNNFRVAFCFGDLVFVDIGRYSFNFLSRHNCKYFIQNNSDLLGNINQFKIK